MIFVKGPEIVASTWANRGTGYIGQRKFFTDLGDGVVGTWNGTIWSLPVFVLARFAQPKSYVSYIAATWTGLVVANNGGNVQLQGAGAHGITSASIGKNLYVTSGTGWTPGFYSILTVDSANNITLNVPFASQGTPTLSGTATIPYLDNSVLIPGGLLGVNGSLDIIVSPYFSGGSLTKVLTGTISPGTFDRWQANIGTHRDAKFSFLFKNTNSLTTQFKQTPNSNSTNAYGLGGIGATARTVNTANDFNFQINAQFNSLIVGDDSFDGVYGDILCKP